VLVNGKPFTLNDYSDRKLSIEGLIIFCYLKKMGLVNGLKSFNKVRKNDYDV